MIRASCGLRSWMQQLTLWQRGRNAQENIVNPAQVVTRRRGAFKKLLGTRPMLWPSSWPTTSESPRRTGLETVLEGREEDYVSGTELRPSRALWGSLDLVFSDPRLRDRVADNLDKWDITESESLLFGRGFGITTDIQTGPNGHLFPP